MRSRLLYVVGSVPGRCAAYVRSKRGGVLLSGLVPRKRPQENAGSSRHCRLQILSAFWKGYTNRFRNLANSLEGMG